MRTRALTVFVLAAVGVLVRSAPAAAQDAGPQLLAPDEVPAPLPDAPPVAGPDRVRSKDGSVTSGVIIVERQGLYVSIRVADGTDVVIRWDEIEKIERGAAPPPPAAAPRKPLPPAPPPQGGTSPGSAAMPVVHLEGPSGLVLEQQYEREWTEVCRVPCDIRLRTDLRYRITGAGLRTSRPFSLVPSGGRVQLDVTPASDGPRATGLALIVTGSIVTPIGLLVVLASASSGSSAGLIVAGLGLVSLITGGIVHGSAAETEVRQPLASSTASARLPTWNATLERAPSPGTSFTIPVFAASF